MSLSTWLQLGIYLVVLVALAKPLGKFMAHVFDGKPCGLDWLLGPVERFIYRLAGVRPTDGMNWKVYAGAMLLFNFLGFLAVYGLQRAQQWLPLNPQKFANVTPDSSFNTAVSFATNTNWQGYGGESTMSYLTQMLGLSVQNFVSAAAGLAVLAAMIRGFRARPTPAAGQEKSTSHGEGLIGNFWVDLTRSTLYILLPLSVVLAVFLISQGVVQSFSPYQTAQLTQPTKDAEGHDVTEQTIPLGPAASQIAIKQLGTNGGGFFNVNSAHPFENPTPLANFFELLSILVISGALCYTFGVMVNDTRQGWAILAAMLVIFIPLVFLCAAMEEHGNPAFAALDVDQQPSPHQPGGNMEGKEAALRHWPLSVVGRRDHGRLEWQRECDARFVHAAGGLCAHVADAIGRGDLWRSRQRPVRHAGLCHHHGVCRGVDGGAHARVFGEKDRSLRDEDGFARDPVPAAGRACGRGGGGRGARRARAAQRRDDDSQSWPARLQRSFVCLFVGRQQ